MRAVPRSDEQPVMGSGQRVIETGELHESPLWTLPEIAELRLDRGPVGAGVLLSGSGRTLENLLGFTATGKLNISIRVVISSKPAVRGLAIVERFRAVN